MRNIDVVRAWKDEEYRLSLTSDELASLPASPVGMVELHDQELTGVTGGYSIPSPSGTTGFWCWLGSLTLTIFVC